MKGRIGVRKIALSLLVALALGGGTSLVAQYPPPQQAPVPPGQVPMRPDGRPYGGHGFGMRDESARILPPGLWWKDQDLVQRLELTPDQQKRIDDTFLQNKVTLIHMHASLDEEQLLLEPLLNANPMDQARVLGEISKIADMRADLEKANARMLLQMRGVLTQQQWTKLQQERPNGMRQHMFMHGPDGPRSLMELPSLDGTRAEP